MMMLTCEHQHRRRGKRKIYYAAHIIVMATHWRMIKKHFPKTHFCNVRLYREPPKWGTRTVRGKRLTMHSLLSSVYDGICTTYNKYTLGWRTCKKHASVCGLIIMSWSSSSIVIIVVATKTVAGGAIARHVCSHIMWLRLWCASARSSAFALVAGRAHARRTWKMNLYRDIILIIDTS